MWNFQRCSRELLISLLKVIKNPSRKSKRKPSQLPRRRFKKNRNKYRKRRRLLNNRLNQLLLLRKRKRRRKLSRLLKSKPKKLPRMPLPKMKTKSNSKIREKESQEVNTVVTTAEVVEADADLAKMRTVSSLSKAKIKSQEEITAVDVVAEAVADAEEVAIVKTNKTNQRVSRSSKLSRRLSSNPRSKRLRRNLLLLRSQQPLMQSQVLRSQQAGTS